MKRIIAIAVALCLLLSASSLAASGFKCQSEVFQFKLKNCSSYYSKYSNNASWIKASESDLARLAAAIFLEIAVNDMSANVVVSDQFPSVLITYDMDKYLEFCYLGLDGLYSSRVILDQKGKSVSFFSFSESRDDFEVRLSDLNIFAMDHSSNNTRLISGKEFKAAYKIVSLKK